MFRFAIFSVLLLGLCAAANAQEKFQPPQNAGQKDSPSGTPTIRKAGRVAIPGEVDIHFYNGSTVRMIVQSEKIDIATPYGKLAVPMVDVRAVEFGLHLPDGMQEKINSAVKSLGSSDYRERQRGADALIDFGPFSYPAVLDASRSKDAEIGPRAKDIVKKLQASHPKKDLKTSTEDKVITRTFTIVGRILTTTMRAKTEYYGDQELSLAKMRTLRSVSAAGLDTELSIDASKYAIQGQWLDTEFLVDGRTTINITARGFIDIWPQQGGGYNSGPNGFQATRGGALAVMAGGGIRKIPGIVNQQHSGMLVGRIGEDGDIFFIGERFEAMPEVEGKLYLHIGPSQYNSPSAGSYQVRITRKD